MQKVPVLIKLFDATLPLPKYQTVGAAGFDLYSRVDIEIAPQETKLIPLNIALQLPATHWLMLVARSSLHKQGLQLINGIGVGDSDFCGNNDEYRAILHNFSNKTAHVCRGDRLLQGIIMPAIQADFQVTEQLLSSDRGGIGSTGT